MLCKRQIFYWNNLLRQSISCCFFALQTTNNKRIVKIYKDVCLNQIKYIFRSCSPNNSLFLGTRWQGKAKITMPRLVEFSLSKRVKTECQYFLYLSCDFNTSIFELQNRTIVSKTMKHIRTLTWKADINNNFEVY